MRESGSYRVSFIRPLSITNEQSSMVMLVSAMFVETTTLRIPRGARLNMRDWSRLVSDPCSGRIMSSSMQSLALARF